MKQCYACKAEVHEEASICPACKNHLTGLGKIGQLITSIGMVGLMIGIICFIVGVCLK